MYRYEYNPIIEPKDVKPLRGDYEVICVFNAGVARFEDEVILLLRVAERPINTNTEVYLAPIYDLASKSLIAKEFEKSDKGNNFSDSRVINTEQGKYLTSISYLRIARSKDGVNFHVEDEAFIFPETKYETFGIEDSRITKIDDVYYINYVGVSEIGIATCLGSTKDFESFLRHGVIFSPDNKDVEIFPENINGKYYAIHRPATGFGRKLDLWLAESTDLINWGNHRHLMSSREGFWDDKKVGGSAVPFKTEEGWIEIYHGVNKEGKYSLGAVLLDLKEPWKIIARSKTPILEPIEDYETKGFYGNVVFSCGVLYEEKKVKIYYGAADTYMCYAEVPIEEVLRSLK